MAVIDTHAHLETRMLSLDEFLAGMDRAGIDRIALIPRMVDPLPDTPDALLWLLRQLQTTALHPLAEHISNAVLGPDGKLVLRGKTYRIYPCPDNVPVAEALAAHPDRFVGWIFLNPRCTPQPLDELDKWLAHPGFVGVKLHPYWHQYPLADALPIARRCEELGLPILVHLGFGDHGTWEVLHDACPELRLVLAHAAIPHYGRAWEAIRASRHVSVDLSSPFLSERLARKAVAAVGARKALFGTDAPYSFHTPEGTYDFAHIKGWVERLPLGSAEIDLVLGNNAAELFAARM